MKLIRKYAYLISSRDFFKTKNPFIYDEGVFLKKGDDILSHKMQYHLRRRA